MELRIRIPLLGGLANPVGCLSVIFGDTVAVGGHQTEIALRVRTPVFGKKPKKRAGDHLRRKR